MNGWIEKKCLYYQIEIVDREKKMDCLGKLCVGGYKEKKQCLFNQIVDNTVSK